MRFKNTFQFRSAFFISIIIFTVTACTGSKPVSTPNEANRTPDSLNVETETLQASSTPVGRNYEFPVIIDPAGEYMFYLHGKIIEDQGLPAVSLDYGEYEYEAILETLENSGFIVISEVRAKGTDSTEYAERIAGQVTSLIKAGVPAENITVVGASQGAAITMTISNLLRNPDLNFVLLGTCASDTVAELIQNQISLYGNVLAIRDEADTEFAGSCEDLFTYSESKGISRHEEIVLHVGTGHGILYQPLDEWIVPAVDWARQ